MKFLKIFIACFLCLGLASQMAGQDPERFEAKAADKVNELNAYITKGNPAIALSEVQQKLIYDSYLVFFQEARKIRRTDAPKKEQKAEIKTKRKALNKMINQEILSQEQRRAKRAGKAALGSSSNE